MAIFLALSSIPFAIQTTLIEYLDNHPGKPPRSPCLPSEVCFPSSGKNVGRRRVKKQVPFYIHFETDRVLRVRTYPLPPNVVPPQRCGSITGSHVLIVAWDNVGGISTKPFVLSLVSQSNNLNIYRPWHGIHGWGTETIIKCFSDNPQASVGALKAGINLHIDAKSAGQSPPSLDNDLPSNPTDEPSVSSAAQPLHSRYLSQDSIVPRFVSIARHPLRRSHFLVEESVHDRMSNINALRATARVPETFPMTCPAQANTQNSTRCRRPTQSTRQLKSSTLPRRQKLNNTVIYFLNERDQVVGEQTFSQCSSSHKLFTFAVDLAVLDAHGKSNALSITVGASEEVSIAGGDHEAFENLENLILQDPCWQLLDGNPWCILEVRAV